MNFPDIYVSEAEKNKDSKNWYKQYIDAAVSYFTATSHNRNKYERLYDSFNGQKYKDNRAMAYLTNLYGVESKLKYVDYRLIRTKVKKLIGEYLEMPLNATVSAINEEAVKEKANKQAYIMGMMAAKPYIEDARKQGMNVYPGVNIPDPQDKQKVFDALNVKRKTEVVMQKMLNKKIIKDLLKEKFTHCFTDLTITAGEFGVCERDSTGKDTFRPIELKNAIYVESASDPLLLRSPFMGERRMMFKHEIFAMFPDLPDNTKKKIEEMTVSPDNFMDRESYYNVYGIISIPVYFIQWKAFKPDYTKISPAKESNIPYNLEISEEEFLKESTQNAIKNKKFDVDKKYIQTWYSGIRIGNNVYHKLGELENVIQTTNGGTKYTALSDYLGCLMGTINGQRVSLFELGQELSEVYNVIRFQINRELSKLKGKILRYDRAFLPKNKDIKDVTREMLEEGILDTDSSQDGNNDPRAANEAVGAIDLGGSQSLPVLVQLGQDIERVLDIITGVTKTRSGMSRASATATSVQTDIEGSVSMTYDIFYYHSLFTSEACKRLCEKTKINWTYLKQDLPGLLYSDEEEEYLNVIRDMSFDDYEVYVSDGKKEERIRNVARQFFPQEINAGKLRTKDVIEFEQTEVLAEGLQVLENAWTKIEMLNTQNQQMQQESAMQQQQKQLAATEQQLAATDAGNKENMILKGDIEYRNKIAVEKAKQQGVKDSYINDAILADVEFLQQFQLNEQQNQQQQQQNKLQV